jgi:hypothetical protein
VHDLAHPGAEAAPLLELAEVAEAGEQRLLEQVSGPFCVLLQPAGGAVQVVEDWQAELFEKLRVCCRLGRSRNRDEGAAGSRAVVKRHLHTP